MSEDVIDLHEDEYGVVESSSKGPITSEKVKRKLESDDDEEILQEDFNRGISDYFSVSESQYPRKISGNEPKVAGTAAAGVVYTAGTYLSGNETMMLATLGLPAVMYYEGLMDQELEFDEALKNSVEKIF